MKLCARCNKPFVPKPTMAEALREKFTEARVCEECLVRSWADCLDLPTPPDLLDRYTKHPTLTRREFQNEISKDKKRNP